jgi:hypothetical protein
MRFGKDWKWLGKGLVVYLGKVRLGYYYFQFELNESLSTAEILKYFSWDR